MMDYDLLTSVMMSTHFDNVSDDYEYDDLFELLTNMEGPEEFLCQIKMFKDEGNRLFKNGMIEEACVVYDKAAKLLSLGLPMCTGNKSWFREIALSLNLNLAICALKLGHFRKAKTFCSLVLEFDPCNVKALYRGALAAMELGLFQESYRDLVQAVKLEPQNHDIQKAMQKAKQALDASYKGKGKVGESFRLEDKDLGILSLEHGESSVTTNSMEKGFECEMLSNDHGHEPSSTKQNEGEVDMVVVESPSACSSVNSSVSSNHSISKSENPRITLVEPQLRFESRQRKGSFLHISSPDYKKMVEGREISFFHPSIFSVLRVRICSSQKSSLELSHVSSRVKDPTGCSVTADSCFAEEDIEMSSQSDGTMCEGNVPYSFPNQVYRFKSRRKRSSGATGSFYVRTPYGCNFKNLRRWTNPRGKFSQSKTFDKKKRMTRKLKECPRSPSDSRRAVHDVFVPNHSCFCRNNRLKRKGIAKEEDMLPRKRVAYSLSVVNNLRGVASDRIFCYFGTTKLVRGEEIEGCVGQDKRCAAGSKVEELNTSHTQSVRESGSGCSQAYSGEPSAF